MRARMLSAAAMVVPALALTAAGSAIATAAPASPARTATAAAAPVKVKHACDARPAAGRDECLALIRVGADGKPLVSTGVDKLRFPLGFGPSQLQWAYQVAKAAAQRGAGQTVAVVDAYDDPNAEADLNVYRKEFGLPPCTAASGCFRKVNQDGQASPLPASDPGWALEESLDIEMVSAVCPKCHIVLAEASDSTDTNVAATVASVARLGVNEISNSYGEPEYAGETKLEPFYDHPGIQLTASAGDSGYGVSYPAASAHVTAVGGTVLWPEANNRGWQEAVWRGSGSGCSAYIPKPSWQHDGCTHRTVADVSAVASESTPVAVFDSFGGADGWIMVAGTSVSSPIVASVYALMGDPASPGGSYFYRHPDKAFDVTSGRDGLCYPAYLCAARRGYDGPTGMGTPDFTGLRAADRSCVSNWSLIPAQQAPSVRQQTTGEVAYSLALDMAMFSRSNVWTAGYYEDNSLSGPASSLGDFGNFEHWNGSRWSRIPSPQIVTPAGRTLNEPYAMRFDRPDDGWALEQTSAPISPYDPWAVQYSPMVLHWDGKRWSLSPALLPVGTYVDQHGNTVVSTPIVNGIAPISPRDVWLDGDVGTGTSAFLEHWNGTTWRYVHLPVLSKIALGVMKEVTPTDIWAIGWYPYGNYDPVTLHYNGRTWTLSRLSTLPGAELTSLSASGPDDVWAAGSAWYPKLGMEGPAAIHWNGHRWVTTVPVMPPTVYYLGNHFGSITAISPDDVWAAGGYPGQRRMVLEKGSQILEHWDGHRWSMVRFPQAPVPAGLYLTAATSHSNVWIGGSQQYAAPAGAVGIEPFIFRSGCGNG